MTTLNDRAYLESSAFNFETHNSNRAGVIERFSTPENISLKEIGQARFSTLYVGELLRR